MSGFKFVALLASAMCGAGMSAQRADSFSDGDEAGQNLLKVLIFNGAWIEAEMFSDKRPHRL